MINAFYGVSLSLTDTDSDTDAAAPAAPRRSRAARAPQRPARRNKRVEVTASAVREWARSNGHQVSDRGRVAAEFVEAYRAAHRPARRLRCQSRRRGPTGTNDTQADGDGKRGMRAR